MPDYSELKTMANRDRLRTIGGLERLRAQLDTEIPQKTRDATLVLGTWNIRNFDDNRFMNGERTTEDLTYIAEIIARFDILAVQEVCDDLTPLLKVMEMLGPDFDFIVTDVTEGRGGNRERLGFIYDQSKAAFQGVAGELVLPDNLQIVDEGKKRQFSRTPFMCSFRSGWFKFMFSTVHIYFGSPSGPKYERRVKEIGRVASFLAKRAKDDDRNHILVGDFNIVKSGSKGHNALKRRGFQVFQNRLGSNKDQTKFYDQISFRVRENELRFVESERARGVLQIFDSIYREDDFPAYQDALKKTVNVKIAKIQGEIAEQQAKLAKAGSASAKKRLWTSIAKKKKGITGWKAHLASDAKLKPYYLKEWRTFHGSDHLPLWVELEIDFSGAYLEHLKTI